MKFALVDGQRREAHPDLSGNCPGCDQLMVSKCGKIKVWHWAHLNKRQCDTWWEPETEWHRNWKGHFPVSWQESLHIAESGERHFADVKTIKDWVIEFQHSHIDPIERQSRNDFYKKLVWVVDGTRRKRDKKKFFESLHEVTRSNNPNSPVRRIFKLLWADDCALIRDWSDGPTPVFFDFGTDDPFLWCLLPKNSEGNVFVLEFFRNGFITFHRNELVEKDFFTDLIEGFKNSLLQFGSQRPVQISPQRQRQFYPPPNPSRPRRHFRF